MSGDDWLENCLSFLIIFLLMILYTFCWVGGYSLAYLGRISDPWHKIDPIPNQSELLRVNWVSNSSGSVLQGCGLSHSYGVILKNKNVSTTWCSDGIDAWEKFLRSALKSQNKKTFFLTKVASDREKTLLLWLLIFENLTRFCSRDFFHLSPCGKYSTFLELLQSCTEAKSYLNQEVKY